MTTMMLSGYSSSSTTASTYCAATVKLDQYTIPTYGPLRLAVFQPGTDNADLQSRIAYARSGKSVPAFIGNDGAPIPAGAPASGFVAFTKDTIGSYEGKG